MSAGKDFLVPGGGLSGRLMRRAVAHAAGAAAADSTASREEEDLARVGTKVGPFALLRMLGSGGTGAVYLAEQRDGAVAREVALKALRQSAAERGARERFWRERQILARLVHPNIAQLHDAGEADGVLYYTMEFVDGAPITRHCRANVGTVAGRVRLLLQVTDAIACAHRNLIIHRDIKPSNVLVTAAGRVKVVDFGIAKSLAEAAGDELTLATMGPMTPQYAAPEQFQGEPLTVATDVYQLGVLMFRVLTGRLPYRADPHNPAAWLRAVTEEEPLTLNEALSAALAAAGSDDAVAPWPRDVAGTRLRRELRGDLDAIVGKALAKPPERRYASVEALRSDLVAWLEGRPVAARRGGFAYRLGRFVRRHRAATAIGVVSLLVLGIAVDRLRIARNEAREQAQRAAATRDFLVDVIGHADPTQVSRGEDLSAGRFLEGAAARVDTGLADSPEDRAGIRAAIARSLARLEGPAQALTLIDRAVAEQRALGAQGAAGLPALLVNQAEIHTEAGDPEAAERAANEALSAVAAAGAGRGIEVRIAALAVLGRAAGLRGRNTEAERHYQEALALRTAAGGGTSADAIFDRLNLAVAQMSLERFAEAEANFLQVESELVARLGPAHPRLVMVWQDLGQILMKRGRYDDADAYFAKAYDLGRQTLDPSHPQLARIVQRRAMLAVRRHDYAKAATLLDDADRILGADTTGEFRPYIDIVRARVLTATGQAAHAARLATQARDALAPARGADNPIVLHFGAVAAHAAFVADPAANVATSEATLRHAIDRLHATDATGEEVVFEASGWLADVVESRGAAAEARALREQSLAIAMKLYGECHPLTAEARSRLKRNAD